MHRPVITAALVALVVLPVTTSAQESEEMTTRVYRVADLIRRVPDYPYQSGIPTTETSHAKQPGLPSAGNPTTGGGGFGGGGGGGGFFQIGSRGSGGGLGGAGTSAEPSHELSLNGLIDVISTSIAPDTWRNSGTGEGTITALGTSLVVRQFPAIQEQITELLAALREQSDFHKMLTVEIFLLPLSQEDELSQWKDNPDNLRTNEAERKEVMSRVRTQASYSGQLTCFSGQQVHLASGHRRSVVTSAIPVVSAFAVGYTPVISTPHIGTLVELTPTLSFEEQAATIDLRCTVTEWNDEGKPIKIQNQVMKGNPPTGGNIGGGVPSQAGTTESTGSMTTVEIQQLNIGTQQLATTIRVPAAPTGELPVPVIVGTFGDPPRSGDDARFAPPTYLVLAVSQADAASQP